jgi:tetratricopeptide (TPR) repeat protein
MTLAGEAFLHGVPTDGVSYRMPLAGVALAWYNGHASGAARKTAAALLWAGPTALAFELGALLQGPAGGALAAVLAALPWSANETGMGEELVYKLLVGLVAVLLAWRAARPTRTRSAALGLAVGTSLLCRSPLFLFPPVLAAYELLRAPRGQRRRLLPGLGVLLLASYILLVPWTLMNWRVHGRFIPLEDGRADSDVATAAIGLAPNLSGNYRWLAGIPEDSRVLPWAVRRVLRRPWPYLKGCLERLRFALALQPLLWAGLLVFLVLNRRREAFRQTALLCAYFAGVHCLLSIEKRYLEPLWVLLEAFCGAGAAGLIWRKQAPQGRPGPAAWPYLAGAAAAGLAVTAFVMAFPGSPPPPAQVPVARALKRRPDDAWLLHLYSRDLLRRGRASAAVASSRRALELAPQGYQFLFNHVWALAASGRATEVWLGRVTTGLDADLPQYADKLSAGRLLETLWHLDAGRSREAGRAYRRALEAWQSQPPRFKPLGPPRSRTEDELARRIDAQLQQLDTRLPDLLRSLSAAWPESKREALVWRLMDGSGRMRPEPLSGTLPKKRASRPVPESEAAADPRRRARQAVERKDYRGALSLLDPLVAEAPEDARLRNDRGVAYALMGRAREAKAELALALRLDPALASAYLSLASLASDRAEASRLYEAALRKACPRLEPELCLLLDEPGPQSCFTREQKVCALIAAELERLRRP